MSGSSTTTPTVFGGSLAASFDSVNVNLRLPFNTPIPTTVDGTTFAQLAVTVVDNSPDNANAPLQFLIYAKELNSWLAENEGATAYELSFQPVFPGPLSPNKYASNIYIAAIENGVKTNGNPNDYLYLPITSFPINMAPSAPTCLLQPPFAFKMNSQATGITAVSGSLIVTPSLDQGVNSIQMCVSGTLGQSPAAPFVFFQTFSFVPSEQNPSFTVNAADLINLATNISTTSVPIGNLKADSFVNISARVEGNGKFSEFSAETSVQASCRLPAPTLVSASSLQDRKVTLTGTILQANYVVKPSGNANQQFITILACPCVQNEVVSDSLGWQVTDAKNLDVAPKQGYTFPQAQATFSAVVTQIGAVNTTTGAVTYTDLVHAKAYRYAAVTHYGDYDPTKSVNIKAAGTSAPKLSQSSLSNMNMTAVTVNYVGTSVSWDTTVQSYATAGSKQIINGQLSTLSSSQLSFSPVFKNSADIPSLSQGIVMSYAFSSKLLGPINQTTNSSGDTSVPVSNWWSVANPNATDVYTLSATMSVLISNFDFSFIQGNPALPVASPNGYYVATLKAFQSNVAQTRLASSAPTLSNLKLSTVMVGTTRNLYSQHISPRYDLLMSQGLKMMGTEHEVVFGVASVSPVDFTSANMVALTSTGSTKLNATPYPGNTEKADYPEDVLIPMYQLNQQNSYSSRIVADNEIYTTRARIKFLDLKSGQDFYSEYSYSSLQVQAASMNPPSGVALSNYPVAGSTNSMLVTFNVDANIVNKPATWGALTPVPFAVNAVLVDGTGNQIGAASREFTAEELYTYSLGNGLTGAQLVVNNLALQPNERVVPRLSITYSTATNKSLRQVGSINAATSSYLVKPNIAVQVDSIRQLPALPNASGPRQVNLNGSGMTSIVVYARVYLNDLSPQSASVACFIRSSTTSNTDGSYSMTQSPLSLQDASKNYLLYQTAALAPDPTVNYGSVQCVVLATHPGSNNFVAVDALDN